MHQLLHTRVLGRGGDVLGGVSVQTVEGLFAAFIENAHQIDHYVGAVDGAVIGIEDRDEAGVGRSLDVVLATQRMQAGARPADLSRDQREVDQAARVVGAVGGLRNPHAPKDDRGFRGRIDPGHPAKRLGVDAANRRHLLGCEGLEMRAE